MLCNGIALPTGPLDCCRSFKLVCAWFTIEPTLLKLTSTLANAALAWLLVAAVAMVVVVVVVEVEMLPAPAAAAAAAACSLCWLAAALWLRHRRSSNMKSLLILFQIRESRSHSRASCQFDEPVPGAEAAVLLFPLELPLGEEPGQRFSFHDERFEAIR